MTSTPFTFDPERFDRTANATVPGYQALQELVALAAVMHAPTRILDVGCGTGTGLIALAKYAPHAVLVGCDPVIAMVDTARSRCSTQGIDAEIVHGTIDAVSPTQKFDAIVSTLVLHFIPQEQRISWLQALRSRLQPGGIMVLTTLTTPSTNEQGLIWSRLRQAYAQRNGVTPEPQATVTPVPEPELQQQLHHAGFLQAIRLYELLAVKTWLVRSYE